MRTQLLVARCQLEQQQTCKVYLLKCTLPFRYENIRGNGHAQPSSDPLGYARSHSVRLGLGVECFRSDRFMRRSGRHADQGRP